MKSKTPFLLPAVAGFAAMLAACAGETVDTETPAARSARLEGSEKTEKPPQDASERRGDARRERRRGHRGMHARGPLGLLKRAVQQLDLSDEQRSELDALRQSMMPREHGGRDAKKAFGQKLKQAILDGEIRPADFDSERNAARIGTKKRHQKLHRALSELHKILRPAQRQQVVTFMREQLQRKRAKFRSRSAAEKGTHLALPGPLLRRLQLSESQREKLNALSVAKFGHDPAARFAAFDAFLGAFSKDDFAKGAEQRVEKMTQRFGNMLEHKLNSMSALLPILTGEQRRKLAHWVGRRMGHGPRRRGHGRRFQRSGDGPADWGRRRGRRDGGVHAQRPHGRGMRSGPMPRGRASRPEGRRGGFEPRDEFPAGAEPGGERF